ncbi:glycosyltransferase family 4 protein [Carboxylicivirga sp. M1479]|uniref:glycosyltransferase family 4 protein n=1 Tax=Carboxylicivirga sp. M1479 TaxID=2594476 RepID=UPI00117799AF|nr:glycosyltransferase family 4 protein [Carboxylicivirga sp. M1479]TRX66349.1 glycosyltransferase family 4 protein [Carboxylicivirga sp. M1479]
MKNIGIVIRSLKPGGAEKQSALLASVLSTTYSVYLFIQYPQLCKQNQQLLKQFPQIKLIHLDGQWQKKIKKLKNSIKHYHISHLFAYLTSDNLIASIAARNISDCTVYGGVRSSQIPLHKFLVLRLLNRFFQKATIFNNHQGCQNFIKKGFAKNKCHVIHNGIEISESFDITDIPSELNIISIGRFVEAKDFKTSILAIKELQKRTELPFTFYLIGYGPLEASIRHWINAEDLNNKIKVIINPNNIDQYYQMGHVYLSTSVFEGLSNSIMEAMNNFMPIVATNVGDNASLIEHDKTGFLIDTGDYKKAAEYLSKLIKNRQLTNSMGQKAYQHLKSNFSIDQFRNKYITLIES